MTVLAILTLLAVAVASPPPDSPLVISAKLLADQLVVGQEYTIELNVQLADGWSTSSAGVPAPILQIDVPKSVELSGKVLETHQELAKNDFLDAPFERLIKDWPARVDFKLTRRPGDHDAIRMNVLAYVGDDSGDARFFRRRLVLPVKPNAVAEIGSPDESNWGKVKSLQIGDKAKPFELPTGDDRKVNLEDYLGKQNVIITTYRAFW